MWSHEISQLNVKKSHLHEKLWLFNFMRSKIENGIFSQLRFRSWAETSRSFLKKVFVKLSNFLTRGKLFESRQRLNRYVEKSCRCTRFFDWFLTKLCVCVFICIFCYYYLSIKIFSIKNFGMVNCFFVFVCSFSLFFARKNKQNNWLEYR